MRGVEEQKLLLEEEQRLIAVRGSSLEDNVLRARVAGVRVSAGGCSVVASDQAVGGEPSWEALRERALRLLRAAVGDCGGGGLAEARLYRGSVRLGSRGDVEPADVVEVVRAGCPGGLCEVVVLVSRRTRAIEHLEGAAVEDKHYYLVEASASAGGDVAASSAGGLFFGWSGVVKTLERLLERVSEELAALQRAKPISPLEVGKARVILSPEAAAVLLHEVSHLLDPDYAGRELRGTVLASPQLTIVDEPATPLSPSVRVFDDEGVEARRRTLVEDGRVVDMHFTRRTAWRYRGRPGSAHGLFTVPVGFHTTLVVEHGDWRLEEMVEEARHGYYVASVAAGFAERGMVRLVPRLAYRVRGRDLEPVRLRAVKVPLRSLHTITAVGRNRELRVSMEKGEWLVAELAPPMLLEAYIE